MNEGLSVRAGGSFFVEKGVAARESEADEKGVYEVMSSNYSRNI